MALTFLSRKADSGLGNIRSSPGDPVRNVDWILLITQGVLTVMGCLVVYSASRTRIADDPFAFVTRQVVFAIIACVVMVFVMSVDYEWFKERAAFLYGLTIALAGAAVVDGARARSATASRSTSGRSTSSRPRWPSSRC